MFIGNKKIVDFFENALKGESLAHAYCLVGPEQVGKRTFVFNQAEQLLHISRQKLFQHPDFYYIERQQDEKTGKLKKNISISQIREMRSRLVNRSWIGGYQVTIINEAELLGEEAANALLKILEEPGEKSIFFLITEDESAVLPTIRSRCQQFYFALVDAGEIAEGLKIMGYGDEDINRWLLLCWGRPGRALSMAYDPQIEAEYWHEIERWKKIFGRPLHLKIKAVEELFEDKEDAMRRKDKLEKILNIWIMIWRDIMLANVGGAKVGITEELIKQVDISPSVAGNYIERLEVAQKLLGQNINARLIFEQLLLNIN